VNVTVYCRELASYPYVAWRVAIAEFVFMAGDDQSTYIENWRSTPVQTALLGAAARGAVVGGTSAGCAVMGTYAFTAKTTRSILLKRLQIRITSLCALGAGLLKEPHLARVITDTYFVARDQMGRLAGFLARLANDGTEGFPVGLGIDEATAVLVDSEGNAEVVGTGTVYLLTPTTAPDICIAGEPLGYENIPYEIFRSGNTFLLPTVTSGSSRIAVLSIVGGVLSPSNPY